MVARCETIGKNVLPVFRSLIAKELVTSHGLTQIEAAQKLGTTQAAISQYINSKRALKSTEKLSHLMPQLQALATETARKLVKNEIRPDEVSIDFCRVCPTICGKSLGRADEDFSI